MPRQFVINVLEFDDLVWAGETRVLQHLSTTVAGVLVELKGVPSEEEPSEPACWDVWVGVDADTSPYRYRAHEREQHLPLEEAKRYGYDQALALLRRILSDVAVEWVAE